MKNTPDSANTVPHLSNWKRTNLFPSCSPDSNENQLNIFFPQVGLKTFTPLLKDWYIWPILSELTPSPCSILHHALAFLMSLSVSVHHLSTDQSDLQTYGFTINENTALKDQTRLQTLHLAFLCWSSTTINSHQLFLIILLGVLSGLCVHLSVYLCHRAHSTMCVQETPAVSAQCVFWSRSSAWSGFHACGSN